MSKVGPLNDPSNEDQESVGYDNVAMDMMGEVGELFVEFEHYCEMVKPIIGTANQDFRQNEHLGFHMRSKPSAVV